MVFNVSCGFSFWLIKLFMTLCHILWLEIWRFKSWKNRFLFCHSCLTGFCHFHRRDNYNILAFKCPRLLFSLLLLPAYDDKETLNFAAQSLAAAAVCSALFVSVSGWDAERHAGKTQRAKTLPSPGLESLALIKLTRPHPFLLLSPDKTMHLKR